MDVLVPNGRFQIHVMNIGDGGQPSKDIRELFGEVFFVFFAPFGIGEGRRQLANFFSQPQKSMDIKKEISSMLKNKVIEFCLYRLMKI